MKPDGPCPGLSGGKNNMRILFGALLLLHTLAASAAEILEARAVAEGVHALVGPIGPRSYDNHGLNANFGVIATKAGTILIDSGASAEGARLLQARAEALTGQPVRWVINTGSQDHRWLGNGHFRGKGVEVIALARTVATQQANAVAQMDGLEPVLKERLAGTEPATASRAIAGDAAVLELGGRTLELRWFADAHFPGDAVVWLPPGRASPSPATTCMWIACWASCPRAMRRAGSPPSRASPPWPPASSSPATAR